MFRRWRKQPVSLDLLPLGTRGERLAALYLQDRGYKILETNFKNPKGRRLGEIDIIAERKRRIIFVEVKARLKNAESGVLPEENIGREKLYRLEKIADYYLKSHKLLHRAYGFDALAVEFEASGQVAIRHLPDIFL